MVLYLYNIAINEPLFVLRDYITDRGISSLNITTIVNNKLVPHYNQVVRALHEYPIIATYEVPSQADISTLLPELFI